MINLFPERDIWTCTLNSELSLSKEPSEIVPLKMSPDDGSADQKQKEAEVIKEHFLAGRANKRSFGVANSRFIPPHQFFAAERYLQRMKER